MLYRVNTVRNGRIFCSWHSTKEEAVASANDCRQRHLYQRVYIDRNEGWMKRGTP